MIDIKEKVAAKIAESGETVVNTVVDKLVELEVNRRVEIVNKSLVQLEKLEKEFKKIDGKLDSVTYDKSGLKIEVMSEKRYQEIQKFKQQIDILKKAFDTALETNTTEAYDKLNQLVGGNKPESKPEASKEA